MENELYHYGVLGMKWGVRRTPAQLAKANGKAKRKSEDNAKKSDMKKAVKSRRTLSDADLKKGQQLRDEANFPYIIHWNQRHFVAV